METANAVGYPRPMAKTKGGDAVRVTVKLSREVWSELRICAFRQGVTLQELFEQCALKFLKAHKANGK
jgi:hypothetical protein